MMVGKYMSVRKGIYSAGSAGKFMLIAGTTLQLKIIFQAVIVAERFQNPMCRQHAKRPGNVYLSSTDSRWKRLDWLRWDGI
jgi:hypothetical protein